PPWPPGPRRRGRPRDCRAAPAASAGPAPFRWWCRSCAPLRCRPQFGRTWLTKPYIPARLARPHSPPSSACMILVVDNYDSFTWNLVHYLAELGAETRVVRNDDLTAAEALALKPEAMLLSPGPCTPNEAGICLALIETAPAEMPIFGVCLGHQ